MVEMHGIKHQKYGLLANLIITVHGARRIVKLLTSRP